MDIKRFILFLLYVIVGVYLLNIPFNFVLIPEKISNLNNWIIFIGGILCVFGAINHFRLSRIDRTVRRHTRRSF